MIQAENGKLIIKGDEMDILCEYSAITGSVLKNIFSENTHKIEWAENLSPEQRAAASFMANLDDALIKNSSLDMEKFYKSFLRLLKMRGYLKA